MHLKCETCLLINILPAYLVVLIELLFVKQVSSEHEVEIHPQTVSYFADKVQSVKYLFVDIGLLQLFKNRCILKNKVFLKNMSRNIIVILHGN